MINKLVYWKGLELKTHDIQARLPERSRAGDTYDKQAKLLEGPRAGDSDDWGLELGTHTIGGV